MCDMWDLMKPVSRFLLQEKLSEQLEEQRQEQALQRYHNEAAELDHWLLSTRATLSSALQPLNEDLDMEEQLTDCQVRRTCLHATVPKVNETICCFKLCKIRVRVEFSIYQGQYTTAI